MKHAFVNAWVRNSEITGVRRQVRFAHSRYQYRVVTDAVGRAIHARHTREIIRWEREGRLQQLKKVRDRCSTSL